MKNLCAFMAGLSLVALCLGLALPNSSFALSATRYTAAEAQSKNNLRMQLAQMKRIHDRAVAAYEATGPAAYFDAIPSLREFERTFLRSKVRGLPSFGRVQIIEDGFVLADESQSIEVKILDIEEGKLRVNGQELSFAKSSTAIDLFRDLKPIVDPNNENASMIRIDFFPTAQASAALGALLGALAGLLFQLFMNNRKKRRQQQPQAPLPSPMHDGAHGGAASGAGGYGGGYGNGGAGVEAPAAYPSSGATADGSDVNVPMGEANRAAKECPAAHDGGSNKYAFTNEGTYPTLPQDVNAFNQRVLEGLKSLPDGTAHPKDTKVGYDTELNRTPGVLKDRITIGQDGKLHVADMQEDDKLYCSGAVQLSLAKAYEGWQNMTPPNTNEIKQEALERFVKFKDDQADGQGFWGRVNGNGFSFAHLVYDLGLGVSFQDTSGNTALPGDYVKIIRGNMLGPQETGEDANTGENGHIAVFRGYKYTDGKPSEICYWSANSASGDSQGLATKCEVINESKIVFSRITDPGKINELANWKDYEKTDAFIKTIQSERENIQTGLERAGIIDCSEQQAISPESTSSASPAPATPPPTASTPSAHISTGADKPPLDGSPSDGGIDTPNVTPLPNAPST